ncbi:MAG: DNA mismatch repair protein MutS [Candidatus Spyradocola sp.]|jgi:DNA mismatch repair protein MutS
MALSPMMQHYLATKEQYKDCILMYRLGDFYEMFFDDAVTVSKALELTLTGRDCGLEERAPMCGVPYHAVDTYIAKLVEKGFRVAICEQMEDPALAKGLVERAVTRVITPGTVTETNMLEEKKNNYLLALCLDAGKKKAGLAYADVSTGEMYVLELPVAQLSEELTRIAPTEVLVRAEDRASLDQAASSLCATLRPETDFDKKGAAVLLKKHMRKSLTQLGLSRMENAVCAAGALLQYLEETQKNALAHLNDVHLYNRGEHLLLDATARSNLELTETMRGRGKRGTLLWLLDRTQTSMGGRLLRAWIEEPLTQKEQIERRLDAVEEMMRAFLTTQDLIHDLAPIYDIERLVTKLSYGSFNARDAQSLCQSLQMLPKIRNLLKTYTCQAIAEIRERMDPMQDVCGLLQRAIAEDPPLPIREGGIIRKGYNQELDTLRSAAENGRTWLSQIESTERETTGIKSLKVGFNKVFGYYIEVPRSQTGLVPLRYERKQTLANCERFTTKELKRIEETVLGAQEKGVNLEYQLFCEVRDRLSEQIVRFQETAAAIKELDALQSLATVANERGYCRPEMHEGFALSIREGRHPVVEATSKDLFVPNDTELDEDGRMMIITGPNMAGKSTYMRQVALIVLMAHMGSFVPAAEAKIPLCDRIFTRVGASDDLAAGQSTFMVEMSEMASILRFATQKSLLILDEIGRGTSTFDGLSIAWATAEYILKEKRLGCKTLFATHYHELSELEGRLAGVVNYQVTVREHGDEILFLRKIQRGGADSSFGVQVAAMAGLPQPLISRAREIMAKLEVNNVNGETIGKNILGGEKADKQISLMEYGAVDFAQEVANLDMDSLSPREALNLLYVLREKARKI